MNWTRLLERWSHTLAAIGQLRHRLTIETCQSVADGAGGVVRTYSVWASVWAGIKPVLVEAANPPGQSGETITHHIIIRYRDGVQTGMRFRQGGDCYIIRQIVDPDHSKCRLVCLCTQEHG
jgi:SPP1 family predicted phage head-tail adaptor